MTGFTEHRKIIPSKTVGFTLALKERKCYGGRVKQ